MTNTPLTFALGFAVGMLFATAIDMHRREEEPVLITTARLHATATALAMRMDEPKEKK